MLANCAVILSACSSGSTLFNNAGPAPYNQPGGSAMPTAMPMPPQPFVGNQLAAAQTAAAQRPTYVYLPAPMPYQGVGYGAPQYAGQPQYAAQPQYTRQARYVAPKKARAPRTRPARRVARARSKPRVLRVKKSPAPVHTASVPRAPIWKARSKSGQQGRLVVVRADDTLYGIARRHNININHLKAANNFQGSHVTVGQKLFIPAPGSHYHGRNIYRPAPVRPPRRGVTMANVKNVQRR